MLEIFEVNAISQFARAFYSLAEGVGNFADPADCAAPQHLNQDLVSKRAKRTILNGRPANHEETAHGIADAADHFGEQHEADHLGAAGNDATSKTPIADAATFDVAAGDSEIGAAEHLLAQVGDDFGRMLEVGVHDAKNASLGNLPTANHGGRESALSLPTNHAHLRKLVSLGERDFPGAVGTVVVDHNDFVLKVRDGIENGNKLGKDGGDIFAFVVGGKHQRHIHGGVAVFGSDHQRTAGAGLQ